MPNTPTMTCAMRHAIVVNGAGLGAGNTKSTDPPGCTVQQLATGCHDGTVRIWDVAKAQQLRQIDAHNKTQPAGQMVATAMGVPAERIEVTVTGELDLRGTLGVSRDVPVGFESIRLHFDIDASGATPDQLRSLQEKTEQYCVVLQTLTKPPKLETDWS